jgi:hypothetical protein
MLFGMSIFGLNFESAFDGLNRAGAPCAQRSVDANTTATLTRYSARAIIAGGS